MRFLVLLLLLSPVAAQLPSDLAVHNVFTVDQLLDDWEQTYPDFVERMTIGESEGGNPLYGVIVTDESIPFNEPAHTAVYKHRVYMDGGHHGNEFLGVEIMLYYLEELLDRAAGDDAEALQLLATTELHAVPILNVEGNLRNTRVNLNGVDPNRNYDFGHTPCSIPGLTCGGPAPFSESEVRANAQYVTQSHPDLWLSMHTGIEVLFYPAGEPFIPTAADQALFDAMEGPFEAAAGNRIDMTGGPAPAVGSAEDWGYAVLGINSFVYEVHNDQNRPIYGEPVSGLLQDQIDGLDFLVLGAWQWGAYVELVPEGNQLRAVNLGWGNATNITVNGKAIDDIPAQSDGGLVAVPADGNVTWSYDKLLVETSQQRRHTATFDVPTTPEEATSLPAALLLVGLLVALSTSRRGR